MKLKDALELMKEPRWLNVRVAESDGWARVNGSFNYVQKKEYGITLIYDYLRNDIRELYEAEKRLGLHDRSNTALRVKWVNCLHDLVGAQPECPVNKSGSPLVSDIDVLLCSTLVRCAAYVMTAEWKEARKV